MVEYLKGALQALPPMLTMSPGRYGLQAQQGSERCHRQGSQMRPLFGECLVDDAPGCGVPAQVGDGRVNGGTVH